MHFKKFLKQSIEKLHGLIDFIISYIFGDYKALLLRQVLPMLQMHYIFMSVLLSGAMEGREYLLAIMVHVRMFELSREEQDKLGVTSKVACSLSGRPTPLHPKVGPIRLDL